MFAHAAGCATGKKPQSQGILIFYNDPLGLCPEGDIISIILDCKQICSLF